MRLMSIANVAGEARNPAVDVDSPDVAPRLFPRRRALALMAGLVVCGTGAAAAEYDVTLDEVRLGADLVLTEVLPPEAPLDEHELPPDLAEHVGPLFNNLITGFKVDNGLLRETNGWVDYAKVWPFGQAIAAMALGKSLPGAVGEAFRAEYAQLMGKLPCYWDDGPKGSYPGFSPALEAFTDTGEDYNATSTTISG